MKYILIAIAGSLLTLSVNLSAWAKETASEKSTRVPEHVQVAAPDTRKPTDAASSPRPVDHARPQKKPADYRDFPLVEFPVG